MIVRENTEGFVLVRQHDHAQVSGVFARHWARRLNPLESTLHAVANHDVAWRKLDEEPLWNEETGRPYAFSDYPVESKVAAYGEGIDLLQREDAYAACLCSMHYEKLLRQFGSTDTEARFVEDEVERQRRLRAGMAEEDAANLGRNLEFLRLCDGLSLFVCLNEPGGGGGYPPPYPEGFRFDGEAFQPEWEDERTLRLAPNPFSEPFEVEVPFEEFGRDRRRTGDGILRFEVAG